MVRSIREAVKGLVSGNEGLTSLVDQCRRKIKEHRTLNAFTFTVSERGTRQQFSNVNANQNGSNQLPLMGIPIAVKDNFCYKEIPTTCGSKMLLNFNPPYTATVVQKLVDAGAIIIGKTNLDEFGMGNGTSDSVLGPTKNIWGLERFQSHQGSPLDWRVPGGSSGGSAVAVASGMCYAAVGSDTGGSIRNPASYCGVVGLKPTYGRLSRYGLIPLVNSMDVPGILARTVDDCVQVFNVMKGFDPKDSTCVEPEDSKPVVLPDSASVHGLRIGLAKEYVPEGMSEEVLACLDDVTRILTSGGASMQNVSLPHTKYSIACYSVLNPCEVASNMARYDGLKYGHRTSRPEAQLSTESMYAHTRQEGFNDVVRGRILTGNYFLLRQNYNKFFARAMKVRRLISNDFDKVWKEGIQLLLTPVTLTSAPKYSDFIRWDNRKQSSVQDYCTQSANMAGIPAISIPIRLDSNDLPLALQLMGPPFSEELLFRVAKYIEHQVTPISVKYLTSG